MRVVDVTAGGRDGAGIGVGIGTGAGAGAGTCVFCKGWEAALKSRLLVNAITSSAAVRASPKPAFTSGSDRASGL